MFSLKGNKHNIKGLKERNYYEMNLPLTFRNFKQISTPNYSIIMAFPKIPYSIKVFIVLETICKSKQLSQMEFYRNSNRRTFRNIRSHEDQ